MFVDFDIYPTQLVSTYRLLSSPTNVQVRQKARKYWAVLLKTQGQTSYTQDGRQIRSDKNHVMVIPKGAEYNWICTEPGECVIINFDAPVKSKALLSVEVSDSSFITNAFAKIERAMNLNTPAGRLEAMQQLYGVLAFLAKISNKKYVSKRRQQMLAPAVDYMLEQYSDPAITNDFLAQRCGVSTVYFRKTFEAVYSTSPIRYLQELRIGKAKAILSSDYDSVAQVGESVGYNSVYHFSKMFKLHTGVSPAQYAKRHNSER